MRAWCCDGYQFRFLSYLASLSPGCAADASKAAGTIRCGSCRSSFHLVCLDLPLDFAEFMPSFLCSSCSISQCLT